MSDHIPTRVFLSYAWESDEFRAEVAALAARLAEHGFDARYDRWHLEPGVGVTEFMNREIRNAAWIVVLATPGYREKVHATEDGRSNHGVAWESRIISHGLFSGSLRGRLVVAILRGAPSDAIPDAYAGLAFIDLRPETREAGFAELLATLASEPARTTRPVARRRLPVSATAAILALLALLALVGATWALTRPRVIASASLAPDLPEFGGNAEYREIVSGRVLQVVPVHPEPVRVDTPGDSSDIPLLLVVANRGREPLDLVRAVLRVASKKPVPGARLFADAESDARLALCNAGADPADAIRVVGHLQYGGDVNQPAGDLASGTCGTTPLAPEADSAGGAFLGSIAWNEGDEHREHRLSLEFPHPIEQGVILGALRIPSATYAAEVGASDGIQVGGTDLSVPLSQVVPPGETDSFVVRLSSPGPQVVDGELSVVDTAGESHQVTAVHLEFEHLPPRPQGHSANRDDLLGRTGDLLGDPAPVQREPVIVGPLDLGELERVMGGAAPGLAACVRGAGGEARLKVVVDERGAVTSARLTESALADPRAEVCVLARVRALRFRRPAAGGSAIFSYSIRPGE